MNGEMNATVKDLNAGVRRTHKSVSVSRKREIAKAERYKRKTIEKEQGFQRPCRHGSKKFSCIKFQVNDIMDNKSRFFANPDKVNQDMFLCRLLAPGLPQRRRVEVEAAKKKRNIAVQYNLFFNKKQAIPVCQKMFCVVFEVKPCRILTLCKKFVMEGRNPKELRGGDRKLHKYIDKRESVRKFIAALPAKESHYSREKSKRIYLAANLNVKKLWTLYNNDTESENLKVKYRFFYEIFNRDFNIGFASPASDACTSCVSLKNKIKSEKNRNQRASLMGQLNIHKKRANAFYALAKQEYDDAITFCFDLQQVQPLPKTPIQEAFYARQISMYVFCCVNMDSRNPTFYIWSEDQASRGATEIGSALLHHLNDLMSNVNEKIKKIRLFCDGCGGQNKNNFILHALMNWLLQVPPHITEVQLHFPVRGHSFLPADRAFGRIEKELKREAIIANKEKYIEIYKQHGTVKELGKDWNIKNIKVLENQYKKLNSIQQLKRIYLKRTSRGNVVVRSLVNFRFEADEPYVSLAKRNKKAKFTSLPLVPLERAIKKEKINDVKNLLNKHFGLEWAQDPELAFYQNIVHQNENANETVVQEDQEMEECDCLTEDHEVHI